MSIDVAYPVVLSGTWVIAWLPLRSRASTSTA
jgi:hypothetical protein